MIRPMVSAFARLRSVLIAMTLVAVGEGCTAATTSNAETASATSPPAAPRVLIQALLFDAPPNWLSSIGVNPATASFEELFTQAGARHVATPTFLATNDAVASMHLPGAAERASSAGDDPLATYQLDVTPHVVDAERLRLEVDLTIGGKNAKTTVVIDHGQLIVLPTELVVDDRPFILVFRPNIIRSDADLQAIYERTKARRP